MYNKYKLYVVSCNYFIFICFLMIIVTVVLYDYSNGTMIIPGGYPGMISEIDLCLYLLFYYFQISNFITYFYLIQRIKLFRTATTTLFLCVRFSSTNVRTLSNSFRITTRSTTPKDIGNVADYATHQITCRVR